MKKRTISLMLALALVFTLCVGVAAPAQAATYFTVSSSTLTVGSTGTIIPTGSLASLASSITYTSSNPSVVSVSNSSGYGMMTALSAGSAIIYAMLGNSPLETIPVTVSGFGYNPGPGARHRHGYGLHQRGQQPDRGGPVHPALRLRARPSSPAIPTTPTACMSPTPAPSPAASRVTPQSR